MSAPAFPPGMTEAEACQRLDEVEAGAVNVAAGLVAILAELRSLRAELATLSEGGRR
jgi:hypothetical protein